MPELAGSKRLGEHLTAELVVVQAIIWANILGINDSSAAGLVKVMKTNGNVMAGSEYMCIIMY